MTRLLIVLVAVFALACSETHGTGDDAGPPGDGGGSGGTCDCCGTLVDYGPGEHCASGVCDPYCGVPPMTCDCCGTTVTISPGDTCTGGVCDPYCGLPPCETRPITLACETTTIVAGRPSSLPVMIGGDGGCYCDEIINCTASLDASGRLQLVSAVCAGGSFCEACFPWVEGSCELPALPAGEVLVDVNGAPGFVLDVLPGDTTPRVTPSCDTVAERGGPCGATWPVSARSTTRVCHPDGANPSERVAIRLIDECGGCEVRGPCHVEVDGSAIRVRGGELQLGCDIACTEECHLHDDTCWTPPLPPGTYDVYVESLDSHSEQIVVYDVGVSPPPFGEVCTGGT